MTRQPRAAHLRAMRLVPDASDYPNELRGLRSPPTVFVRGTIAVEAPKIAIVGARRASEEGRAIARRLATEIAERGGIVVSGGALGVDAAAHAGALDGGGRTWVVLPTPLDEPYPRAHLKLFERILESGGAWLSEREERGHASAFRERNRVIAALAVATVVVEARERSGTRHTADAARRMGRALWVVPWSLHDPRGEAGRAMLRQGASVLTRSDELLKSTGLSKRPAKDSANVSSLEGRVLAQIGPVGATPVWLAQRVDEPLTRVLTVLTRLEMQRAIEQRCGRFVRRRG